MAGPIRIELSETALAVSPGGAVTTRCTVYNTSVIVDEYRLQVAGIEPDWFDIPPSTSRIFPEAIETIALTFHPPRSAGVAAGDYDFDVIAVSSDNEAITASASGTLTVDPFVDFGLDLASPRQISAEIEGTFKLRLTNTGNSALGIALSATDETGQLELAFSDSAPTIPANQSSEISLTARPNEQSIGSAAVYQITISASVAHVAGGGTPPDLSHTVQVMLQTLPGVHEPPVLSPQSIELGAQHAQTQIVLRNRSSIPMSMALSASDKAQALSFEFVGGDQITVPPQGTLEVLVRITCLDRNLLAAPPTPTYFTIVATPIHPAGDPRTVQGELTLPSPADFRLRLEPEVVESTVAQRVQLIVENLSPRAETFVISAASKDASLAVDVANSRVEIPGRSEVTLPIELVPNFEALSELSAVKSSGYTIRVAPADSPALTNEISGQYVFTPAALAVRLKRKEIEAVAAATYDVEIENTGRNEVTVELEANDRSGACTYVFDLPRVRVAGRSSALVQLIVTPPAEHKADARWEFAVEAKPVSLPGTVVRDSGILIYRSPSVAISIAPPERRGRRKKTYHVALSNPTALGLTVKLAARDHSGGLGVGVRRDTVKLAANQTTKVPVKVTPRKRPRGSGEASLAFTVVATPVAPPGDATTVEGTFVALPPRSRWIYAGILALLVAAYLYLPVYNGPAPRNERIPLYEQTFYWTGWVPSRSYKLLPNSPNETITVSGRHRFHSDASCVIRRVFEGDAADMLELCFAQGPRFPGDEPERGIPSIGLR